MIRPGDVLLFHRAPSWERFIQNPLGYLMTSIIHLSTGSRWNHAAICVLPGHYAEATAGGVTVSPWGSTLDEVEVVRPAYDDDEDRWEAVAWASARTGVRYGYWNAFMCGLNNLLAGFFGWTIKRTDSIICSELVAEALERAGYDFWPKDATTISPGDLAEALGVRRA